MATTLASTGQATWPSRTTASLDLAIILVRKTTTSASPAVVNLVLVFYLLALQIHKARVGLLLKVHHTCDAQEDVVPIIQKECVGKEYSYSIQVTEEKLGKTSCRNIVKRLAVKAVCWGMNF
ncbi:hypothetical protein Dsin_030628 [Dipteronia sinensis]|uniref:Uncharacterized protein n=1 Tax=Dipteronia sinensis TaxID=43782 RepID=A0AAD9ZJR0_9ROSI|nr:hypothetical protein Dsin_030628 [Dipteronia sinensis]